ncbi:MULTISPECIES: hypothetical protein [Mycolicibacterium]|uniref:hypothetical protein n=1 Tax=Mycolicibacterium TaxID=1866885 RepID=UPI001055A586|nr:MULTISPECIES: hypothetical protein [Mycolicibacterium]MCV7152387.1 hypothetical protein [Mycolicibacterium pyrenivorans]
MMITETACAVPFFANIDLSPNHPRRCDTKAIVRRAVSGDIFFIDYHNAWSSRALAERLAQHRQLD